MTDAKKHPLAGQRRGLRGPTSSEALPTRWNEEDWAVTAKLREALGMLDAMAYPKLPVEVRARCWEECERLSERWSAYERLHARETGNATRLKAPDFDWKWAWDELERRGILARIGVRIWQYGPEGDAPTVEFI